MSETMDRLVLPAMADYHVHVRQGLMLAKVLPYTLEHRGRIMVMPNTIPSIDKASDVEVYRKQITGLMIGKDVDLIMSIKLLPSTTPEIIRDAFSAGAKVVKLYPAGMTTNTDGHDGGIPAEWLFVTWDIESYFLLDQGKLCFPDKASSMLRCFEEMQKLGMILSLHGEMPGSEGKDAEQDFLGFVSCLLRDFPNLKIILEHITTRESVEAILSWQKANEPCRIAGTITPHHLWYTHDDVVGRKLYPWRFHLPLAKTRRDREKLIDAATSGARCFFAGTDDAPHPLGSKECHECCAGVWNSPTMMPALLQVFENRKALNRLADFIYRHGNNFYGLEGYKKTITWAKKDWKVPETIMDMRPFLAGHILSWKAE